MLCRMLIIQIILCNPTKPRSTNPFTCIWRIYILSSVTFTCSFFFFLQISRTVSEATEHIKLLELVFVCIPLGILSEALDLTVWKVHSVLRFDMHFKSEHWSSILSSRPIYLEWFTYTYGWMDDMSQLLIDLGEKNYTLKESKDN